MSKQQKILIVDDERININILVDLLKADYKIMVAINGQQALKAARSESPPNLILLDVMMPEMDGYEVCSLLKSDDTTREIPVIFVTAMGEEHDEIKGLKIGAVDYLTKPVSAPIVKARIKTQLALKQHMEDLREAYAIIATQRNRMQKELNIGRDIQLAMVPKNFPCKNNFSIHAILEPAREVGGDFYDVFNVDEEHICFSIGDVSGKGVPAALFMAMTKTLIKSRAASDASTASIVTHVNDELSKDNEGYLFVTLFVCILNIRTGELITTNAGHNPPYLKHADGSISTLKHRDGPVAAAVEGFAYTEQKLQLIAGDILLLFTDGITEAGNPKGILFGNNRLENILRHWQGYSVNELTTYIVKKTHEYEGEDRQADDITVLALDYHGHKTVDSNSFETEIGNHLASINLVNDQFTKFAQHNALPKKTTRVIHMVFDELLSNIISYASEDKTQHIIHIHVSIMNNAVVVVITDNGLPFNPFQMAAPETNLSIDDRQVGGLGIHLVSEMLDQVSYQRKVNQNVVTLIKNIEFQ